ncbi:MAG: carboxy terminal-processing peptidase [Reichenbachiella sp.]
MNKGKIILAIWLSSILGVVSFGAIANASTDSLAVLQPKAKYLKEAYLINANLKNYHFRKQELNDSLSAVIFSNFLSSLDYNKTYFLKADIDYFKRYEFQLDDLIKEGNVDLAFQIFKIFRDRANVRIDHVVNLAKMGFDYTKEESISIENEELDWAETTEEINERWRKIVKNQAVNLLLSGKEESDIEKSLTDRYERYRKGINQYNSDDVFQFYMNAFTESYDPHTNYFSPMSSEDFNISMSLSLEGIGARLTQSMDYTVVNEVIAGGPAYKSKQLQKDDKIVAVAQGEDEMVDVIGWRLRDVVKLIRGPKGSTVRLSVLKDSEGASAVTEEIVLIRDKIKLEESSAKSELIPITEGNKTYKLGVITLPSFYINFDEARRGIKDYKSTTRDVRNIISELKTQDVDGILIDLRFNGGGSLKEAIDMTGLFIDRGPVVQVKDTEGQIDVKNDMDFSTFYDGPLAVLTNRFSASASEIFAGAIQDYKRGIILGETSFGKGTVQNLIDLNRMFQSDDDELGQLKLTLAKFYRVTGSSTQNIGVTPDIEFPSPFAAEDFGESSRPNSLPWDRIQSSNYVSTNQISDKMIHHLRKLYAHHLKTDLALKYRQEDVERMNREQKQNAISLNLQERKNQQEEDSKKNSQRDELTQSAGKISKEFSASEENLEKLNEDIELKESLRLLAALVKDKVG